MLQRTSYVGCTFIRHSTKQKPLYHKRPNFSTPPSFNPYRMAATYTAEKELPIVPSKVVVKTKEANSFVSFSLKLEPEQRKDFHGQWSDFFFPPDKDANRLSDPKTIISGFSMTSSPNELNERGTVRFTVKKTTHPGTIHVHDIMQVGDTIHIKGGQGPFFYSREKFHHKKVVLIGAGVGTTPLWSILSHIYDSEPEVSATFIHSVRNEEDKLYMREIEEMMQKRENVRAKWYVTSTSGRMTSSHLIEDCGDQLSESLYYVCGPKPFVDDVSTWLREAGVKEDDIQSPATMKFILQCCSYFPCATPGFLKAVKTFFNVLPWLAVVIYFGVGWFDFVSVCLIDIEEGNGGRALLNLIIFHVTGGLCMWSYFATALASPKMIQLDADEQEDYEFVKGEMDAARAAFEQNPSARILVPSYVSQRLCKKCTFYKPERTHHCSWCNTCIVKMDHHCPWVGNCVGGHNYKYFVLLLFYTPIFTGYSAVYGFYSLRTAAQNGLPFTRVFLLSVIAISLCMGVACLLSLHLYLLFSNTTTLEFGFLIAKCSGCSPAMSPYNKGSLRNFESVFGTDRKLWPFPMENQVSKVSIRRPMDTKTVVEMV
ncbi:putative palmitoyltransferase ZDHHC20-like [Planoprotostelium fungivorum]|uniref:Palmitoyltransferase n=1 Tax=Planoprotostelium fungivorum TaxID=1890364 RepID=A0A2P6N474_9EUKA|nr:putative palmitoyltransferase ZDHHC20-like [Planoprotostelium fungivorum]